MVALGAVLVNALWLGDRGATAVPDLYARRLRSDIAIHRLALARREVA